MLLSRKYQVKDVMEMYGITRDTIKYYERNGLIHSERLSNGYRVFDEINVRKLKKILSFRDLGMTIEETLQHCESDSAADRMEIMEKVRRRTEDEIRNLNRKLKKIHELEHNVSENPRFSSGFNAGYNLSLCVDCPHVTPQDRRSFMVVSALKADLNENGEPTNIEECELIRNEDIQRDYCYNCPKKQFYKQFYRYRIEYQNMEKLKKIIRSAYADLKLQNYIPHNQIFMMRKVIKQHGEDVLILDTLMLLEE